MASKTMQVLLGGLALGAAGGAASAQEAPSRPAALAAGKPILEIRPRYEHVDQANVARDGQALTVRMRLGYETGAWNSLKGLVELEGVKDLLGEEYNSTVNDRTRYPVIGDPEGAEVNRLQVSWSPSPAFSATLGRQRINFDDQRFVGGAAWRQDEQTFDAVRADVAVGKVKGSIVYVDRVNRVFAEDMDWKSDSWLVNVAYAGHEAFKPALFVYALDFPNAPANSSLTSGVRVAGKARAGSIGLGYAASYARQTDHGNNPESFGLDYWTAELAGTAGAVTVRGAYESFQGNGARAFQTPLGTLHAFQGWADVFLTTPPNGLQDANIGLTIRPAWKAKHFSGMELTARYHSFEAERDGADLGDEFNLLAQAAVSKQITVLAKWADYDGAPGLPSRQRFWLGFEFKL